MTIHPEHTTPLERFAKYYKPAMLMLGATGSVLPAFPTAHEYFGQWVGDGYEDMDLDGGDLELDLNTDIGLSQTHRTVFNMGTIEHVWNAHNAWANALRAVEVGGCFLTHSPVSGFKNHGLHITSAPAMCAFVSKNGFTILEQWSTTRVPGELIWLAARKDRHIEDLRDYEPATQIYDAGKKKEVI